MTVEKPGVFPVLFMRNPDDKVVKYRWHVAWVVMEDVEGNHCCVLKSLPAEDTP